MRTPWIEGAWGSVKRGGLGSRAGWPGMAFRAHCKPPSARNVNDHSEKSPGTILMGNRCQLCLCFRRSASCCLEDPSMNDNDPQKSGAVPPSRSRPKPAGLKEIAAYLNLSPATVSMVVNDVPLAKSLSEETRARVMAAAKKFNYRPNLIARALSKRETRTVGVIAPESSDGYFPRVMRGIENAMLA